MAADDLYLEFINKLKKDKTQEEAGEFLANLLKFGAAELYYAIMLYLTDEDAEDIEKIADDKKAQEEVKKRFKLRTGVTPEEFVGNLRDRIAKDYLFPELKPTSSS